MPRISTALLILLVFVVLIELTNALTKLANKTEKCDDVLDHLKEVASSVKDWMEEKRDNFREKMAQATKWLKHAEDIPLN